MGTPQATLPPSPSATPVAPSGLTINARPVQNMFGNPYLYSAANQGETKSYVQAADETQSGSDKYCIDCVKIAAENDGWQVNIVNLTSTDNADEQLKITKEDSDGKILVLFILDAETAAMAGESDALVGQLQVDATPDAGLRMAFLKSEEAGGRDTLPNPIVSSWNADGTDPTLQTDISTTTPVDVAATSTPQTAVIAASSAFANIQGALAVWTDDQMSVGDFIQFKYPVVTIGGSAVNGYNNRPVGETLAQCGYFSEKSYDPEDAPGDTVTEGQVVFTAADTSHSFFVPFKFEKAKTPIISIFSPNSGNGGLSTSGNQRAYNETGVADITPTVSNIGTRGFRINVTGVTAGDVIAFHWVANAGA